MTAKTQVKIALANKEKTMSDIAEILETSIQNLSQKFTRNTIKYVEMQEIAEILGYRITWIENESQNKQQDNKNVLINQKK